jgi:hypothetical protein
MISFRQADLLPKVRQHVQSNEKNQARWLFQAAHKGEEFYTHSFDDVQMGDRFYSGDLYVAYVADYRRGSRGDYYTPDEPAGYDIGVTGYTILPGDVTEFTVERNYGVIKDEEKLKKIATYVVDTTLPNDALEEEIERHKIKMERD